MMSLAETDLPTDDQIERVGLEFSVMALDPLTEIAIHDGHFQVVARGIGRINATSMPAGLYEAVFSLGPCLRRLYLEVTTTELNGRTIAAPELVLPTERAVRDLMMRAENHAYSTRPPVVLRDISLGEGAEIVMITYSPADALAGELDAIAATRLEDADGLTLRDAGGRLLANLSGASAWRLSVQPGDYRLRYTGTNADQPPIEQALTIPANWRIQLFLRRPAKVSTPDVEHTSRVTDLGDAVVLMSRKSDPYISWHPHLRLVESARGALTTPPSAERAREVARLLEDRQTYLGSQLSMMLREKFDDPMLGLYAAHLLLQAEHVDFDLVEEVTCNLRKLIGVHPDVLALEWRLAGANRAPQPVERISCPPMLLPSWRLVLGISAAGFEPLEPNGLATQIVEIADTAGIGFVWPTPSYIDRKREAPSGDAVQELLKLVEEFLRQNPWLFKIPLLMRLLPRRRVFLRIKRAAEKMMDRLIAWLSVAGLAGERQRIAIGLLTDIVAEIGRSAAARRPRTEQSISSVLNRAALVSRYEVPWPTINSVASDIFATLSTVWPSAFKKRAVTRPGGNMQSSDVPARPIISWFLILIATASLCLALWGVEGGASTESLKLAVCGLLVLAGIAAMMWPILGYVFVGWLAKRKDIMDGLNADARLAYFEMFSRSGAKPRAEIASAEFERLYSEWYGRRFFLAPALLLFLVTLTTVTIVVLTVLGARGYMTNPLFEVPETAMAALAGAYLWVINDLTSRARRFDLAPSDIQWGTLRLIISIPMGYAFAAIAASAGPFVAFALGAFPLATLTSMLRRLADKRLGLEATAEEATDDIIKLQGINRTIVERLSNEDITTVTQVAYCDPVQLVMRSNLTFNFVIDCMNQALAWLYLQDELDTIRLLGVRGAVEIKHLIDDYDDASNADPERQAAHTRATAAFPKIAAAIKQDAATLQIAFREIAEDPYTIFLDRVWT